MKDQTRMLMRQAASLLVTARKDLDLTEARCQSCGLKHYRNYVDYLADKQLAGMVSRLQRFADADPTATNANHRLESEDDQ
jgi:hypothetical protein